MRSSGPFARAVEAVGGRLPPGPSAPSSRSFPVGLFGRYELVARLGDGELTEVFLARPDAWLGPGEPCALKRIKRELCSDIPVVSRFIDEARIAVRFDHPHVVKVLDFGAVAGIYYLALEYVHGGSLAELLSFAREAGRPMPVGAALYVARAAALGLQHAHDQRGVDRRPLGIVHGDVRPENVLVGLDGAVKVTGFSCAPASPRRGASQAVPRALGFRAPEVLFGAASTVAADVWSLGVLLHEMLTGQPLFSADDAHAVVERVQRAPMPPPSSLRAGLSPDVDELVLSALQRAAGDRPASAVDFADRVEAALQRRPFSAADLCAWLQGLDDEAVETELRPRGGGAPLPVELPAVAPAASPDDPTLVRAPTVVGRGPRAGRPSGDDRAVKTLRDALAFDGSVWTLVRHGEDLLARGAAGDALSAFRTAAAIFAFRGHLVQALCAIDGARALLDRDALLEDLRALGALRPGDGGAFLSLLQRAGGRRFWDALRGAADDDGAPRAFQTPFLGALDPDLFARVALGARVRALPAGVHVLREGEPGDALFAVGQGRLVVTCTPKRLEVDDGGFDEAATTESGLRVSDVVESVLEGIAGVGERRVFLSALSDGDFFGEFSFLTGRPRSASVETVTPCRLLEVSRAAGTLFSSEPQVKEPLLAFYKERVVEWMLAKNAVFSLLDAEARRELLHRCGVVDVPAGRLVVREGEMHDAMYFLKRGEVEVYSNDDGVPVFINKLGPGDFFGEIAALSGQPRTASVRAITDLEVFRIGKGDLEEILERAPEVRARMQRKGAARSAEIRARVAEQRRLLGST